MRSRKLPHPQAKEPDSDPDPCCPTPKPNLTLTLTLILTLTLTLNLNHPKPCTGLNLTGALHWPGYTYPAAQTPNLNSDPALRPCTLTLALDPDPDLHLPHSSTCWMVLPQLLQEAGSVPVSAFDPRYSSWKEGHAPRVPQAAGRVPFRPLFPVTSARAPPAACQRRSDKVP